MSNLNLKERREDYALAVVPESYRRWSWLSLFSIVLGMASSMFFLAWGSDLLQTYGAFNLILGMLVTTVFVGSVGFLLATTASKTGLDMDLITSGAGFGYKGAGVASLIWAVTAVIYFATEGSIIASAIHTQFPVMPLWSLYILVSFIFVPLTWYGLTMLNYVMWISLPIYIVLLVWSINIARHTGSPAGFFSFMPARPINLASGPPLLQLFGTSVSMIANGLVMADIGRFIPKRQRLVSSVAISYINIALCFLGSTLLGAWLGLKFKESNPGIYFPALLGVWGVVFVILTQIRINLLNAYGGSLAFTTFFSRIFNFSPGRYWWTILIAALSVLLMFGNILSHLVEVLTFQGMFIISWAMAVVSYLLFNKNLRTISSDNFAFQKGSIPHYHPIGLTSLFTALLIAVPMAFGLYGPLAKTLAPLLAAAIAFLMVPVLSLFIKK